MNFANRSVFVVLAVFAFLSYSGTASATFPLTSDLAGHVVDENGQPLEGMVVVIRQVETNAVKVRRTNHHGLYRQLNLRPDGTYTVFVVDPTSLRATVVFPPGELLLGTRMRRNVVMPLASDLAARGYAAIESEHPRMATWPWKQQPEWLR